MTYFFILLLRLVAYLEGQSKIISFILVFLIIVYSTFKRTSKTKRNKISKTTFYSLISLLVLIIHSILSGNFLIRDFAVLVTYWIWFVFTMSYFKNKTIDQCLNYILISFLIYNVSNYIFYDIYFSHEFRGINTILRFLGIEGARVYFPLSSGANVFTSQLALNALIVLHFIKTKSKKILYITIYCFYILMLVMADSRLILLFMITFSIVYWFSLKRIVFLFKKYWLFLSLMIIIGMYIFYTTSIFDEIKRPGERSGAVLSRIEIWEMAINVIFDDIKFIFGHGINGFENNIEGSRLDVFQKQSLQTSHNFIIQSTIDFGILGLLIILTFIFELLRKVLKIKSYIITILVIMILFMGGTESIPTFYSFEPTLFFIALVSIIITKYERKTA